MTRLTISTLATPTFMGQQVYERAISARAAASLGPGWQVRQRIVRSLRAPLPGTDRLPAYVLHDAPSGLRRSAGAVLYRGSDVVHRMDLRLPPATRREILTIHDVVSWRFTDEGSPPRFSADEAKRAFVVICPSRFSAEEVSNVLGVDDPVVIENGVDRDLFDAAPLGDAALAESGIRRPFVLHAGGCSARKNLSALADAWRRVQPELRDAQLVLVGPSDNRRSALFDPLPGTRLLGRVDDKRLRGLMHAAAAVVVPSVYEGFGLPALEAMACGTPLVAADASSLPEVCGGDALLVPPDGRGLAEGIEAAVCGGPEVRARARRGVDRARAFTWERSADRHAALWRAALG